MSDTEEEGKEGCLCFVGLASAALPAWSQQFLAPT
jgi:hypothetical protein